MHKSEIFFWLLVAFLVSVGIASAWRPGPQALLWFVLAGVVVLAVSLYRRTFGESPAGERWRKVGTFLGVLLLMAVLGAYRFTSFYSSHSVLVEFAAAEVKGEPVAVGLYGYVDGETAPKGTLVSFPFRVKELVIPNRLVPLHERILVTTTAPVDAKFGDELRLVGKIRIPRTRDGGEVFSLRRDGIRATVGFPDIEVLDKKLSLTRFERSRIAVYRRIFHVKGSFEHAVNMSLAEPAASYMNGILLGTRSQIPADLTDAFKRTGTTHILAISGYNITIIAQAILWLCIFAVRRKKALGITVAVILIFVIMTGASASVVRAAVMGMLVLAATGLGRLYDPRTAVALAGAAMVVFNPLTLVFDVGFQLSFISVLGLLYIYPVLARSTIGEDQFGVKEVALMTCAAQIAVLPLIIYYFGQVSLVSLPVNIVVLPFVPVAMLAGFLTGIAGLLLPLFGCVVGVIAWAVGTFQLSVIRAFAAQSFATVTFTLPGVAALLLYVVLVVVVFRFRIRHEP